MLLDPQESLPSHTHTATIFRRNYLQLYKGLILTFFARRNGKKKSVLLVPLMLSAEIPCGRNKLRHSDRCKKYRYLFFHTLLCRKEMTVIFLMFSMRPYLMNVMCLYLTCAHACKKWFYIFPAFTISRVCMNHPN